MLDRPRTYIAAPFKFCNKGKKDEIRKNHSVCNGRIVMGNLRLPNPVGNSKLEISCPNLYASDSDEGATAYPCDSQKKETVIRY